MKKSIFVLAFALLVFFAIGTIYAQSYTDPLFSGRGTDTLRVSNPNRKSAGSAGDMSGIVCVYFTDAGGEKNSNNYSFSVPAGKKDVFVTRITGATIDGWSTISCQVTSSYN
jgi:hypothetical protein